MKRVLMVAYHYPPVGVSSGIQRTLKFSQHLREFDWQPSVLTVSPRAYASTSDDQMSEVPEGVDVRRAFGLDAARHLAVAGRYPRFLCLPDRWSSWWFDGVRTGMSLIRKYRPDVIWSTYPIATAHLIGLTLQRLSGLPWVADCRDLMTEEHYPADRTTRKAYQWIERKVVSRAERVVFTTPGTRNMYANRYPLEAESKWAIIPNGFDEENFCMAEEFIDESSSPGTLTLVHSGVLYPLERDPTAFFDAIAELKHEGKISAEGLQIRLRATGHDDLYRPMIEHRKISDVVKLEPRLIYRDALAEMLTADGLLIFQASNCNRQIPAKLYEYFRAMRPIFALTDPRGDTAGAMKTIGIDSIARMEDMRHIKTELLSFLDLIHQGRAPVPRKSDVASFSRHARAGDLAGLMDSVVEQPQ